MRSLMWVFIIFSFIPISESALGQAIFKNSIVPFTSAVSNNAAGQWPAGNSIDHNLATAFSSNNFPSSVNSNGTYLAAQTSASATILYVILSARVVNGVAVGFPRSYEVYVTNVYNNAWVLQGTYTNQPVSGVNPGLTAVITLPLPINTFGVMIKPTVLGVDNYNNYYFQLAEIQMAGPSQPIPIPCRTLSQVYTAAASPKVGGFSTVATSLMCAGSSGGSFPSVSRVLINGNVKTSIAVRRFNFVGLQRLPPYLMPINNTNIPTTMPLVARHTFVIKPPPPPPPIGGCLPGKICLNPLVKK